MVPALAMGTHGQTDHLPPLGPNGQYGYVGQGIHVPCGLRQPLLAPPKVTKAATESSEDYASPWETLTTSSRQGEGQAEQPRAEAEGQKSRNSKL